MAMAVSGKRARVITWGSPKGPEDPLGEKEQDIAIGENDGGFADQTEHNSEFLS
jgi:hypothetical protein